jgi:hypothetical protein
MRISVPPFWKLVARRLRRMASQNLPRKTLAQMKELFDEYRNRPTKSEIIPLEHTRLPSAMILMRVGHCRSA